MDDVTINPVRDTGRLGDRAASEAGIEQALDRLALAQALHDVEAANARVVDLSHRLVTATQALVSARLETETLRFEKAALEDANTQLTSSRTFRLAARVLAIRDALRP